MGQDKALMMIAPDEPPIVQTVARKLGAVANEILLVGTNATRYSFLDLPMVPDLRPGNGPLGGIYSVLAVTGSAHVLVVACDLPFLNVSLLRYMASIPRDFDVLVPVLDRPQPLHAIYAPTCLPLIEQALLVGRYMVTGWFEEANVRTIERETIRQYDPALLSCYNMNTPEDYETARQVLAVSRAAKAAPGVETTGGD